MADQRNKDTDSAAHTPPRRYVTHYGGPRRQDWTTPRAMFDALNDEYGFTMDGAATCLNALLPSWKAADDILVSWAGERVFCNPPWKRIAEFVELAAFAELAVLLVPARVNARWFHRALELGAEVRFFLGRPRFGDGKGSSPFDCLLLVFRNCERCHLHPWKELWSPDGLGGHEILVCGFCYRELWEKEVVAHGDE